MGILSKLFGKKKNSNNNSGETSENNTFNVEIGEPFKSIIDYSKSDEELLDYYNDMEKLIKQGNEDSATIELMMLGYGLDFIDFVKEIFDKEIKFSEDYLEDFELILRKIHGLALSGAFKNNSEDFENILKQATGYFGIIIIKKYHGDWVSSNLGMSIKINETTAFVYNRIGRKIANGEEDSIVDFYKALQEC